MAWSRRIGGQAVTSLVFAPVLHAHGRTPNFRGDGRDGCERLSGCERSIARHRTRIQIHRQSQPQAPRRNPRRASCGKVRIRCFPSAPPTPTSRAGIVSRIRRSMCMLRGLSGQRHPDTLKRQPAHVSMARACTTMREPPAMQDASRKLTIPLKPLRPLPSCLSRPFD